MVLFFGATSPNSERVTDVVAAFRVPKPVSGKVRGTGHHILALPLTSWDMTALLISALGFTFSLSGIATSLG